MAAVSHQAGYLPHVGANAAAGNANWMLIRYIGDMKFILQLPIVSNRITILLFVNCRK